MLYGALVAVRWPVPVLPTISLAISGAARRGPNCQVGCGPSGAGGVQLASARPAIINVNVLIFRCSVVSANQLSVFGGGGRLIVALLLAAQGDDGAANPPEHAFLPA